MGAQGSIRPDKWYASATVIAGVSPSYSANEGFGQTITRNGVGDYSLPLAGIPSQAVILASALGSAFACTMVEVIGTPVTSFRVRTLDAAGAAVDASFGVIVIKS